MPKLVTLLVAAAFLTGMMTFPQQGANAATAGNRSITINASDENGNPLHMWVTIKDITNNFSTTQNVASGFTPFQFQVLSTNQYKIGISDFGIYHFDHWSDTDYSADTRCSGATGLTTLNSPGVPIRCVPADTNNHNLQATYKSTEVPAATTPLHINAVDQNGNPLTGTYSVIYKCATINTGCSLVSAGWTPLAFGMSADGNYYVQPVNWITDNSNFPNFKGYFFDHWANGFNGLLPAGSPPTTVTAVYRVVT